MHVSLAEALEVRGGPLLEEEVWAVLSQSAESLQELFHKGTEARVQRHGILWKSRQRPLALIVDRLLHFSLSVSLKLPSQMAGKFQSLLSLKLQVTTGLPWKT